MTAAIYARKSTDQSGISDVTALRRVSGGASPRLRQRKRWHIVDEHVYVDDGISGAESRTALASCG